MSGREFTEALLFEYRLQTSGVSQTDAAFQRAFKWGAASAKARVVMLAANKKGTSDSR